MITNIQEQLERDEGRELTVYNDQFGNPTVGIGHKLDRDEHYPCGITADECCQIFDRDLITVEGALRKYLPWASELDDARYGVLKNLCFNMGIHRLMGFTHMLLMLREHEFQMAAYHLMNSLYAAQVPDRAKRLEKQLITGEWQ